MKNKSSIILLLFIIVLLGIIAYLLINPKVEYISIKDSTENNVSQQNEIANIAQKIYKYEELKGTYQYKKQISKEDNIDFCYDLYLNNDGTFCYEVWQDTRRGVCGNYIINNSNIILNNLFTYGTDTGITTTSGTTVLNIKEDGTITDSNSYENSPTNQAILEKTMDSIKEDFTLKHRIEIAAKDNGLIYGE